MSRVPRPYSPRNFLAFARDKIRSTTEDWQVFCVTDPQNECVVDLDDLLRQPGVYELRKLEKDGVTWESYGSVRINENGSASPPGDPNAILARTLESRTATSMDAMLMANQQLQNELRVERDRNRSLADDNDRYRDLFHNAKDELRKASIEEADASREAHFLELGLQAFSVWMNSDFRSQFRVRLEKVFKSLPDEQKQAALDLFNSDAFRLPPEMQEGADETETKEGTAVQ